MKRVLRFFFLSDLRINLSYPLRMGILYWLVALSLLVLSYTVLKSQISDSHLVLRLLKELFIYELVLGFILFLITSIYAVVSSSDYRKIQRFADEIAKGNFEFNPELSPIADKDLISMKESLNKLRKSLIISRELLKKRSEKI
ncbi:hypothetical protein C7457_1627 [Thermovibrio guaymasensis]|uniref:HAMP domain-containing protein n=1 Tax=Thermovibrio guaymasensis TaxID=240167 RepID=A0A420W5L6_9BACT|nr:histidine kinase [Thermovibrio guaymasensis]RKQ60366.1 hypothetical protein C7457_1627 [Thermovibrio guaymasensis]